MHSVVTSFGPAGWNLYAKSFVDSFYECFPPEVGLWAFWEGSQPKYPGQMIGGNLLEIQPCANFLARHRGSLEIQGKKEGRARWGPKARKERYSYRHDAYKFARKVFAVAAAARRQGTGKLFWIDADVIATRKVTLDFLNKLLPDDVSLCYLARTLAHSELGFVGYNLNRIETHAFITAYEAEYSEDVFLRRQFWDDCNVFDALVHELSPTTNKIPSTRTGQPFDSSVLGEYMIHLKGKRKVAG